MGSNPIRPDFLLDFPAVWPIIDLLGRLPDYQSGANRRNAPGVATVFLRTAARGDRCQARGEIPASDTTAGTSTRSPVDDQPRDDRHHGRHMGKAPDTLPGR